MRELRVGGRCESQPLHKDIIYVYVGIPNLQKEKTLLSAWCLLFLKELLKEGCALLLFG